MHIKQILSHSSIRLDLSPSWEEEEIENPLPLNEVRRKVTREMAEILYESGKIQNLSKLCTELFNLEKRSSSAIGCEIAIPHLRCLQTNTFIMGFARYTPGVRFDAPDNQNVRIFIPMIAPLHDDRQYLRFYRNIARTFLETDIKIELLSVEDPDEVIKILHHYLRVGS